MTESDWEFFRFRALKAVGLLGHKKANEAYAQAWKHGYEGGADEVLAHLEDIAGMILGDHMTGSTQ